MPDIDKAVEIETFIDERKARTSWHFAYTLARKVFAASNETWLYVLKNRKE